MKASRVISLICLIFFAFSGIAMTDRAWILHYHLSVTCGDSCLIFDSVVDNRLPPAIIALKESQESAKH